MISQSLLDRVACPVCLAPDGCGLCARPGRAHRAHEAACVAEYAPRARCACGGPDKLELLREAEGLRCPCCAALYAIRADDGYLDLRPRSSLGETTRHAAQDFREQLHVHEGPPLLSARLKVDMMLRLLDPEPGQSILDLGCGTGKLALFAAGSGFGAAGIDAAPFFLPRATREVDLVLGDLRRLPFRKGSFPRAYSLDVLEHLDADGVRDTLVEARRTIGTRGRLFVYTHAMESSRLALFQRGVNRLAGWLGARGLLERERGMLRKSDHRNPIESHEHFEALSTEAGLCLVERRYYNVFFKAIVEDLLWPIYDHKSRRNARPADESATVPRVSAPSRAVVVVGLALTWLLKADVVLFGGVRTGPFFGLLEPSRT